VALDDFRRARNRFGETVEDVRRRVVEPEFSYPLKIDCIRNYFYD